VQPADSPTFRQEQQHRGAFYQETRRSYPKLGDEIIVGTAYLWDGDVIAQEAPLMGDGEAAWAHATHWYYEPDSFKPLAKQTADGALFYIVTDHLGTPREMFSEDGKLVWAAQYRSWGAVKHIWQADNDNEAYHAPNPSPVCLMRGNLAIRYDNVAEQSAHEAALNCPIRFQGQWENAESGLYYNRHRYYDPLVGQYMSPDPLGIVGGTRPNGYVENPNSYIDPLGLTAKLLPSGTPLQSGYTRLYRTVDPKEYSNLLGERKFSFGPTGSEMKQFGLNVDEVLKFSNFSSDYAAIVSVDVPTNMLQKLGFSRGQIDPYIFREGVVTVQGAENLKLLNEVGQNIQHAF